MPKRPVLDLTTSHPSTPRPTPADDDEPTVVIYCRCPQSLAQALKDIAHERSRGRRKRTTVNELVIAAIQRFVQEET